jgi:hypothetical protein
LLPSVPSAPADLDILKIDDGLRLAMVTAVRSQEMKVEDAKELYEQVVLEEISPLEYMAEMKSTVKKAPFADILLQIDKDLSKFV